MGALACKMRCMRSQLLGRIVVAASLLGAMSCSAQTQYDALMKQLNGIVAAHHGKVALFAVDDQGPRAIAVAGVEGIGSDGGKAWIGEAEKLRGDIS